MQTDLLLLELAGGLLLIQVVVRDFGAIFRKGDVLLVGGGVKAVRVFAGIAMALLAWQTNRWNEIITAANTASTEAAAIALC